MQITVCKLRRLARLAVLARSLCQNYSGRSNGTTGLNYVSSTACNYSLGRGKIGGFPILKTPVEFSPALAVRTAREESR